jgi:hypothetical protein
LLADRMVLTDHRAGLVRTTGVRAGDPRAGT